MGENSSSLRSSAMTGGEVRTTRALPGTIENLARKKPGHKNTITPAGMLPAGVNHIAYAYFLNPSLSATARLNNETPPGRCPYYPRRSSPDAGNWKACRRDFGVFTDRARACSRRAPPASRVETVEKSLSPAVGVGVGEEVVVEPHLGLRASCPSTQWIVAPLTLRPSAGSPPRDSGRRCSGWRRASRRRRARSRRK